MFFWPPFVIQWRIWMHLPIFRSTFEQHFREVVWVAYWYVWARLVIKYFDMGSGHALTAESHGSLYLALFSKHCILMCALWSLVYVFLNVDSLCFSQAVSERGIPVSQITRNLSKVCQYLSLYSEWSYPLEWYIQWTPLLVIYISQPSRVATSA